ncbi:hypothetical protein T09_3021 [Trichinella sp. T9]|nr:hypothetical protein T09_3021 [Trichinella sp. T9]
MDPDAAFLLCSKKKKLDQTFFKCPKLPKMSNHIRIILFLGY